MINALHIAQTGLNASKYAVENVANNIANENTPGYKKRVVEFSEIDNYAISAGQGVNYSITRITASYMYGNLVQETSKLNYNEEISQILENAEALFAETEDSGFSANLDRYYQSVENLRSEPSNEIYQTDLSNNAKYLVESLQKLYDGIEKIELVKSEELNSNVEKVNNILSDIGKINEKLADYDEASQDLLDKRDNLEAELAKYVDVEVTNYDGEYELKIAGHTAVRYSTNIRNISLDNIQEPQVDRFSVTYKDSGGNTITGDNIKKSIDSSGNISDRTFEVGDVVTYTLNSDVSVSVTMGDKITGIDLNGNEVTYDPIDETNLIRAIALAINNDDQIRSHITAFNGNPEYDKDGNLVELTDDKYLVIKSDKDGSEGSFESRISIEKVNERDDISRENIYRSDTASSEASDRNTLNIFGSEVNLKSGIIKAQIEYTDSTSPLNKLEDFKEQLDVFANTLVDLTSSFYMDNVSGEYEYGTKAGDELEQLNLEPSKAVINLNSHDPSDVSSVDITFDGSLLTLNHADIAAATNIDELAAAIQTAFEVDEALTGITVEVNTDGNIVITDTEKRVISPDNFDIKDNATTPASISGETLELTHDTTYAQSSYGLNLFSGSDVKSLKFNAEVINSLDQTDLDYLASLQWKDDVSFTGKEQNSSDSDTMSISEFYQSIRVSVSSEKESIDFELATQKEVKQSLEATYESIVKVDQDEEMTSLIKFQAAYTASAKVITVVDEMLQTLLGIKR